MFGAKTRDEFFFRALLDHARLCVLASKAVAQLFSEDSRPNVSGEPDKIDRTISHIDQLEHEADELVRKIVRELRETWILPLDREDIRQLAITLDNVVDAMEAIGHRLRMFDLRGSRPHLDGLCAILIEACEKLALAVALLPGLKRADELLSLCQEVDKLEVDADHLYREGLAELFRVERDPIMIMKWSQVFEFMETSIDATNDVADLLEGIVLEYA